MTSVPSLVSCKWLHDKITAGDQGNIVIVDVSWASTKDCHEEYKKKHIQGAGYINVLDAKHTDLHPRNIPSPETFTAAARKAGVNTTSHVIVYSNSDRAGYFLAGRGWWTFRLYGHAHVSILDGGLTKWLKEGYPTTDDCPEVKEGNFTANRSNNVFKSLKEIQNNVVTSGFQLIDTRANTAYKDSHIPNAKNVPLQDLVDNDTGLLKSTDQIKKILEDNAVDVKKPLVTHCNSGMSSCSVAFIAELMDAPSVAVFHGGFTEWKNQNGAQT